MPHPLSQSLRGSGWTGRHLTPGTFEAIMVGESAEIAEQAADALDAHYESLEGLEIVECRECGGLGTVIMTDLSGKTGPVECYCNGTGKVLRKREG